MRPVRATDEGEILRSGRRVQRTPPTLAQRRATYEGLFQSCVISPAKAGSILWYRQRMVEGRPRYENVGSDMNIPWYFIAVIHALEGSCNFRTHLHNGDPLSARTVNVPAGRPANGNPPFSWEESARDALTMDYFDRQTDWTLAPILYRLERFNGWGYFWRGLETPYLWSFSNHYTRGKFVRDGVYDPDAVSDQAGAAVLLKDMVNRGIVTL
jgi:lysozyme family protein